MSELTTSMHAAPVGSRSRPRSALGVALLALSSLSTLMTSGCALQSPGGEPTEALSQGDDSANEKTAFDFFLGEGLTAVQAAGVVGNLVQESGVDPTIAQSGGGPGRGIAQWSVGGRWDTDANDNAVWYAGEKGEDVDSLNLQLQFIWYELNTFGYGLSDLQAATNVTDATTAFQNEFEGCGDCDPGNRIAYAQAALANYGGDAPGSTSATCSVGGVSGVCIDTGACNAKGNYQATAGYCAGADDIQCCTAVPPPTSSSSPCGELAAGHSLGAGAELWSCSGIYELTMQTDGNLVLYHKGVGALWATGTETRAGHEVTMQADGNLVVYSASGAPLWASQTSGHSGAYLAVQDDGNVVVYAESSSPLWASGTHGR